MLDLVSGAFSAFSQHQTNQANKRMAREQMAFQERMSSTAHQREVEDLRKAGLNPLLSVNAGASSAGGAMAHQEPAVGAGVSSARETYRARMEGRVMKEDVALRKAQQAAAYTSAEVNSAHAREADVRAAGLYMDLPYKKVRGDFFSSVGRGVQQVRDFMRGSAQGIQRVDERYANPPRGGRLKWQQRIGPFGRPVN